MTLVIASGGMARAVYGEDLDLTLLGAATIRRASHVEPDAQGFWHADLSPVGGPALGPFAHRSEALTVEIAWLEAHWVEAQGVR